MTRPYAEVIGNPIAQSKSPAIHNFWLRQLAIDAGYAACYVRPGELEDYLAARRADPAWRGCNVTMPHKQAVTALLDQLDPLAARIGAVNTIVPEEGALAGYNTDAGGFLEPLGDTRFGDVAVIGAGGAARAVVAALAGRGIGWLTLQNRDVAKAQRLLDEFALSGEALPLGAPMRSCELLVNASPLGMEGQPEMPALERFVAEGGVVYDIVTHPVETALLRRARARGLRTIDGLAMLIGQAALAFERFFAAAAPRGDGDAALRRLLSP